MLLPYKKARYSMFQELHPNFPRSPISPISHGPCADDVGLAKRITEMILPSLAEMIEKSVSSAFNGVSLTAIAQNTTLKESVLPATRKSQPVKLDLLASDDGDTDDEEELLSIRKPPPVELYVSETDDEDTEDETEDEEEIQFISESQPAEMEIADDDDKESSTFAAVNTPSAPTISGSKSLIWSLQSTQVRVIAPSKKEVPTPDIMVQALQKIQILTKKPTATWTCDAQYTAMQAVLARTSDVLALMYTGSGKTMLGVVPSLLEKSSITVVVLPLKSLMADYIRKLDEMGVPYEVFTSSSKSISGSKNLVLVSVDRARTEIWHQALAEVNLKVKVARLVVDEGQLALTAENYRKSLQDLYELRQFPMQLVVLSGTLQPISEQALMDSFGLAQSTLIIRTPTVRPELQYILEKPKSSSQAIARRVLQIVNHYKTQMLPRDRVLVFVPYIAEGQALALLLGCKFYNGGTDTTDTERQLAYDAWIKGTDKIMICTAAFGAGNDYPYVRLVIHAGTPQELIGCIQEKSRAGRDGQLATCYFLPKSPGQLPEIPPGQIDHQGKVAAHQWLFPKTPLCLRYGLTLFCDGTGTNCGDHPSYQKCSVCSPSLLNICPSPPQPLSSLKRSTEDPIEEAYRISKKRRVEKQTLQLNYVDKMMHALEFFCKICPYCKVNGNDVPKHDLLRCPQLMSHHKGSAVYIDWRKMIKYDSTIHHKLCYFCHVPQCDDKLHGPFVRGTSKGCFYPDIIAPVVYAILHNSTLVKGAQTHFKQNWENRTQQIDWLCGLPIEGEKSNISALFLWYYNTYCIATST